VPSDVTSAGECEDDRDSREAAEKQMRLQTWLNGLLEGGLSFAAAIKPWREPIPNNERPAEEITTVDECKDECEVPRNEAAVIEQSLAVACIRIRERQELSGNPPHIGDEDQRRQSSDVIAQVRASHCAGRNSLPWI